MISSFAKPIHYPIPDRLKEFVSYCILGKSDNKLNIEYPMYGTGFPVLILAENIPEIITDGEKRVPDSKFNIAGQIYESNVAVGFNDQVLNAIGLILSPAAPYYLFHSTANKLLNKWTEIENITPINLNGLLIGLEESNTEKQKLDIIFEYLDLLAENKLPAIDWLDRALNKILMSQGVIEINQLINEEEISERHFRRKFQEIIGMPPKYYCKVIQITSVFQLLQKEQTENLTQIALNCGYFDQSHFIKDFKKHIGLSPNNFLNSEYSFISTYLGAT